ncbi:MAG: hypothetical protein JXR31_06765 [Prolixibacteraceae bacterium]|nr:hypothetical protein [Prolixibacteraceae bacterium]MBN2773933.1 hypothetical protein [Prolixibacteraceae bacterium]
MKRLIQHILIILFISAGIVQSTEAQRIKASASLDSTNILIGDQVTLYLKVDKPVDVNVNFPKVGKTISDKIEVLGNSEVDTIPSDNEKIETLLQAYIITCFDSGSYYIPNYWFGFDVNGLTDSTPTNSLTLNVRTLAIDTTKGPTDIKMPYDAPVTLKEVMPYILGIILIGAILFFILYSIKRKKQNKPIFSLPQKPKEPAHVIALRELDRIKAEKLWQKDKIKQYYSEVTDAVRTYIENRFEIGAMEQTSEETISAFRYRRDLLNDKHFENLKQMLTIADMVKFAKFIPLPDEHNKVLFDSYFFVNETKKEVEKPVEKKDKPEENGNVEEVVLK